MVCCNFFWVFIMIGLCYVIGFLIGVFEISRKWMFFLLVCMVILLFVLKWIRVWLLDRLWMFIFWFMIFFFSRIF